MSVEDKIDELLRETRAHRQVTSNAIDEIRRDCLQQTVGIARLEERQIATQTTTETIERRLEAVDRRATGIGAFVSLVVSGAAAAFKALWDAKP